MEKETTEENPERKLEEKTNGKSIIVSFMQDQYNLECTRKESLRSKGTHFMTVTALIITGAVSMFVFCVSVIENPLFIGILFLLWVEVVGVSFATLLYTIKSQRDIKIPVCDLNHIDNIWYDSEKDVQVSIYDFFKKSTGDIRIQNDKTFEQNKKSTTLLKCSVIFFIIFLSFCTILLFTQV